MNVRYAFYVQNVSMITRFQATISFFVSLNKKRIRYVSRFVFINYLLMEWLTCQISWKKIEKIQ